MIGFVKAASKRYSEAMKQSFLAGLVFFYAALAQADLVVIQKVEGLGPAQSTEMTLKIKGDKIRADIAPEISTITDAATGEATTLMHAQKAYMQINAEALGQLTSRLNANQETALEPSPPQSTGKHETVNGVDTEIYTAKLGQMKVTYWIAKEFPEGDKLRDLFKRLQNSPMAKLTQGSLASQPFDLPGVAVRTRMEPPNGQKLTVTLFSVKEQELDHAEFEIPRNYQSLPSPAFGAPQKHP
jgi:hypothetical protein